MGSRERRRAERRKRKARSAGSGPARPEAPEDAARNGSGEGIEEIVAEAEAPVGRSERKDREARARLKPLRPGERPLVVTIGAVVSALISLSVIGAYAAGAEVDGDRPSLLEVLAPTIIMGVMAYGMWRARYWAVLGFQAAMALLMIGAVAALIQATDALQAIWITLVLAIAAAFFYLTVKALARIQMPQRSRED